MSTPPVTIDVKPKGLVIREGADAAYDREDQAWFNAQPTDTLAFLWGLACADISGAAWDDEVYDALAERGWFD